MFAVWRLPESWIGPNFWVALARRGALTSTIAPKRASFTHRDMPPSFPVQPQDCDGLDASARSARPARSRSNYIRLRRDGRCAETAVERSEGRLRYGSQTQRPVSILELVRQTDLGLRPAVVQAGQAPGLEDRRAVAARREEVALCDVDDEVVAHHVVHRPERLHVEVVGRVDRRADDGHDAPPTVERERGEGGECLPVPE